MYIKKEIITMESDPAQDLTLQEAMGIFKSLEDEQTLADIYAHVENTAWWYAHDIDDFSECTEDYQNMCKKVDEWFSLAKEIEERIIDALKSEGQRLSESGIREIVLPFMTRNGYYDANGWWIKIGE